MGTEPKGLLPLPRGIRYLDHAATSLPKPAAVLDAVESWYRYQGVSPSRGHGRLCDEVAERVAACRARAAQLFGVAEERLVFLSGATEALNLTIRGMLPADATSPPKVITTAFEHSSVVRPLRALQREGRIQLEVLSAEADGTLAADQGAVQIADMAPDLLVCTHASNVTGQQLPVAALAAAARQAGAKVLLDAAQTAGYLDLTAVDVDVIVTSGHKQLHGPPGVGILAARDGVELAITKQGGTGSSVALADQPQGWPTGWESGTPNTPAILGLGAALQWLDQQPAGSLLEHGRTLADRLRIELGGLPGVRVLPSTALPHSPDGAPLPVVSLTMEGMDPTELAMVLEGIGAHVRTGHHCAPWLHGPLGTGSSGTLRLSPGPATTDADIDAVVAELAGLT